MHARQALYPGPASPAPNNFLKIRVEQSLAQWCILECQPFRKLSKRIMSSRSVWPIQGDPISYINK
jgi:hypothetical protein